MTRRRAKSRSSSRRDGALPAESFAADAATVAWLVSCLFTLGGNVTMLAVAVLIAAGLRTERVLVLARLSILSALLFGIVTLALTYQIFRLRRVRPPRILVFVALTASLVPWGVALAALAVGLP